MQIIRNIPGVLPEPCVATIGFFDGVHMGHRFLIEQVRELAAARGLRSALITFPIHPRKVMNADYRPELLTTSEEKLALLEETGVDYSVIGCRHLSSDMTTASDTIVVKALRIIAVMALKWE